MVLSGDHPLVSAELIAGAGRHPPRGRGRRHRDHRRPRRPRLATAASSATRTATSSASSRPRTRTRSPPEVLAIREINTGTYAFEAAALADGPGADHERQRRRASTTSATCCRCSASRAGASPPTRSTTRTSTSASTPAPTSPLVSAEARRRILERHMLAGVTIVDPASTWIDADVEIAADATIEPGSTLRGETRVGAGSVVGPHTTLIDSELGDRGHASRTPTWSSARSPTAATVGPFAYLRPAPTLGEGAKAGAFVEIKNSRIGDGRQGAAPLLRRRRRRRRGRQPRRRDDHRQLRRLPQAPDEDRGRCANRRRHDRWSPRSASATTLTLAPVR